MDGPQPLDYESTQGAGSPGRRISKETVQGLLACFPLLIAAVSIPWFGFVGLMAWFNIGDFEPNRAQSLVIDVVSLSFPAVGLIAGVCMLRHRRGKRLVLWILIMFGCIACAAIMYDFVWQDIQWHKKFSYG
jgi:hypothetical protein